MANEALRRADDLLADLVEAVETARAVPMSASCVLPRERLLDLLDELREVLPSEMDEARRIVALRERMLDEARERAATVREDAVAEADAVLADARHQAEQRERDAQRDAADTIQAAQAEHARLIASTTVHQAAAEAASALRKDAENYQAQIAAEAAQYDGKVRGEADRYVHDVRSEAERYATKLTTDAEDYAERTLGELSAVLNRSATTAEQGRAALAERRAGSWIGGPRRAGDVPLFDRTADDDGDDGRPDERPEPSLSA